MPALKNAKHERFAQELAKGQSATKAHVAAGYKRNDGNASKLANAPDVAARVKEITGVAAEKAGITAERVLTELGRVAFLDVRQAVKWGEVVRTVDADGKESLSDGVSFIPSDELNDDTARTVAEVSQTKDGVRIKFHDKLNALAKIGQHLGMFKDHVEHTGKDGKDLIPALSLEETARRLAFLLTSAARSQDKP